jgi:hypothetical protein
MKKRVLIWVAGFGILAGIGALTLLSYWKNHSELVSKAQEGAAIEPPAKVGVDDGDPTVTLDEATQKRMDIKVEAVSATARRRRVVAYGALEEDPAQSFVLRAPAPGTIQLGAGEAWPDVGQTVADAANLGAVEPRLAPTDRATLGDRLASARAEARSSRAALNQAQSALARARELNADNKNVSDRVVQEAEARVATEQARLEGAEQSTSLLAAALTSNREASVPLELPRGGVVIEVMAHPGESVESGAPILRVARFGTLLARVDVPLGDTVAPGLASAVIAPLGYETRPLAGERVGLAAAVDPKTQGQPLVFRVRDASGALRPGLAVTAYLETPGAARKGAIVPGSAVVWHMGKSWVYAQTGPDKFARREVALEDPAAGGWFTTSLDSDDKVVTRGAQMLLSEEFKSQIRVEDEN